MKITCNRGELAQKLEIVAKATAPKSTMPILGGIRLTAKSLDDDVLTLEATNLEVSLKVNIKGQKEIKIFEEGQAVVSGKVFAEAVDKLSGQDVVLTVDENKTVVESGKSKFTLPVFQNEEYPDLGEMLSYEENFTIEANELNEAVKKTSFATVKDDPRPFLTGVLFEVEENVLKLVATDVNRLAIYYTPLLSHNVGNVSFLVPVKSLKLAMTAFDGKEKLFIWADRRQIWIKSDVDSGVVFSARLLESQYPKYGTVIPKDTIGEVKVSRYNLIRALERVQLVDNKVLISVKDNRVYLAGQEQDRGSVVDEIEVVEKQGADLKIGFNVKFLLEYLKVIDGEYTGFAYNGTEKPTVFRETRGGKTYTYIAMPVKLPESELDLVA